MSTSGANGYLRARKYMYDLILSPEINSRLEAFMRISVALLIVLNVVAIILETVEDIDQVMGPYFQVFEVISVMIFSVEYLLRLWSVVEMSKYRHPVWGRLRYIVSFMALIDLLAILPFYLPVFSSGLDLRFMRAMRMLRLLRVLKLGRYSYSFSLLSRVMAKKKNDIMAAMFVLLIILIISSSLMFFLEHEVQPKAFSNIPASLWWGIATLTTVGYGDIYPVTVLGKFCAAIISVLGIGLVALPSGIIVTGFVEEMQDKKTREATTVCPHCGKEIKK